MSIHALLRPRKQLPNIARLQRTASPRTPALARSKQRLVGPALAAFVLSIAGVTAAGPAAAKTSVSQSRTVAVTLTALLGEPRMVGACDEESFFVLASRGRGGVEAILIQTVYDLCSGDEAEETVVDLTNVSFKVTHNLGRAALVADGRLDDGRQFHLAETFRARGPRFGPEPVHERFKDESGMFLFHQVLQQRFVKGTGVFGSTQGFLLRQNQGTLSLCRGEDC